MEKANHKNKKPKIVFKRSMKNPEEMFAKKLSYAQRKPFHKISQMAFQIPQQEKQNKKHEKVYKIEGWNNDLD